MTFSDWVSLVALGVAITTGVVNYLYTKRTFEASAYPLLQVWLIPHKNTVGAFGQAVRQELRFTVALKNHSSSVSIAHGDYVIYMQNVKKNWGLLPSKRIRYDSGKLMTVEPLRETKIQAQGSVEQFLREHDKVQPRPMRVLAIVTYKPGISGARSVSSSTSYILSPKLILENEQSVIDWEFSQIQ